MKVNYNCFIFYEKDEDMVEFIRKNIIRKVSVNYEDNITLNVVAEFRRKVTDLLIRHLLKKNYLEKYKKIYFYINKYTYNIIYENSLFNSNNKYNIEDFTFVNYLRGGIVDDRFLYNEFFTYPGLSLTEAYSIYHPLHYIPVYSNPFIENVIYCEDKFNNVEIFSNDYDFINFMEIKNNVTDIDDSVMDIIEYNYNNNNDCYKYSQRNYEIAITKINNDIKYIDEFI